MSALKTALLAFAPVWILTLTGCQSAAVRPSDVREDPRFGEARRQLAAEDPSAAVATFIELLPEYGQDPGLLRWLGRARILAGDDVAGRADLRRALAKQPEDAQARLWLADSAYDANRHQDAVDAYELVRRADPEQERALRRLVDLYLTLGEEHKALAILETDLLSRHPDDADLRRKAIAAAMETENFEAAEKHARYFLQHIAKEPDVHEALALALVQGDPLKASKERLEEAAIHLGESARLDPNDAAYQFNLALVLDALARHTSSTPDFITAEKHYRRALEIDPRFIEAIENLADMYLHQNNPQKAYPLLEEGLRLELSLEQTSGLGTRRDRIDLLKKKLEKLRPSLSGNER